MLSVVCFCQSDSKGKRMQHIFVYLLLLNWWIIQGVLERMRYQNRLVHRVTVCETDVIKVWNLLGNSLETF
jgi:hypothetical protein